MSSEVRGARAASVVILCATMVLGAGCERKAIPARSAPALSEPEVDPASYLAQGERVFFDDFERAELGAAWTTNHKGWRIVDGHVYDENAKNKGLWLVQALPEKVRISFRVRSGAMPAGKPFPGDVKCEVFASEPEHEAGYVLINGGWTNQLDVIARLDEHGKDRKEKAAMPVLPDQWARWDIVRVADALYWFRDGALLMTYEDEKPLQGTTFGFNNWASRSSFDDLAVYSLP